MGGALAKGRPVGGISDTTMDVLQQAMVGASIRHRALANNVANANTPGYRRTDLDFKAALRGAVDSKDAGALDALSYTPEVDPRAGALRADGNTVDIDREMAQLAGNTLEYQTLAAVLKTRLRSIEAAIGAR
jgi:flagellar basal-body rod protein FlgB